MHEPPRFATTRWSLVAALRDTASDGQRRGRLAELGHRYWYPVYAYLRRSGHEPDAAYRLTVGFYAHLLRDASGLAQAADIGRFRAFLQQELHRYLAHEPMARSEACLDLTPPLTLEELEVRHQAELGESDSPERALQRGFALEILGQARAHLREEARDAGHLAMYEALEQYLGQEPGPGVYEVLATRLRVRPMFVALAVKRLRQRYRELVESELEATVSNAAELEDERALLLAAIGGDER